MSHSKLLQLLLDHPNEWLSGNQLAAQLAVSRTMVWKRINTLIAAGYQIERKHNLGYRYLGMNNLSAPVIQQACRHSVHIDVFEKLASTNQFAKELLSQQSIKYPHVVIANQQTAGYGRRGRHFYSPANSGLYLTIAVPVDHHSPFDPGLLTTTTAVAVVKALAQSYPTVPFRLKWINDIWVHAHKVGGIMTESVMDVELMQPTAIIVGIGINLSTTHFPAKLNQPVASIASLPANRNQVAADIIDQFLAASPTYQTGQLMAEYRNLSVVIGKQVTISTHDQPIVGTVETIADNGALVLRTADGRQRQVMTGEVTKVRMH